MDEEKNDSVGGNDGLGEGFSHDFSYFAHRLRV